MTQSIGTKIKKLREDGNISIDDFAERTRIAKDQIELIESSKVIPSMGMLTKIVRVLGVRLGTLLDGMEQTGPVISRGDCTQRAIRLSGSSSSSKEHLDFFSLSEGKNDRHMEPFIIDVASCREGEISEISQHEGEEFIYVLSGEISITYGTEKHVLKSGDSIYYDSIVPHRLTAITTEGARILAVVYVPV